MNDRSFRQWLHEQIQSVLLKPVAPAPFVLWCDSRQEWRELLQKTCGDTIELWAEDAHELLLRHRFVREERRPRVIWLPRRREDLSFFRVFEGEASFREMTLLDALREYGVEISRSQEDEVKEDLLAYALAKLDEPFTHWKKITPDELISTGAVLAVLADIGRPIENRISAERRQLFKRRVTADFGFPEPDTTETDKWRIRAVATLLATDAAVKLGEAVYPTSDWVIPEGNARGRALELLDQWQRDLQLLPRLEALAGKADALLNLESMVAGRSCKIAEPLASHKAERALFQDETNRIKKLEVFQDLATYLARKKEGYRRHAGGFWGQWTKKRVPWKVLADFAQAAEVLKENDGVEAGWSNLEEAITWYRQKGWQVDAEGESLMQEGSIEEGELLAVQRSLRDAYQHILDRTNTAFSDFAQQDPAWPEQASLPYAGEALKARLDEKKDPTAVIIVDAFRFELGKRLAGLLNDSHTSPVAEVQCCRAPVPTTTELGMAYALPGLARSLFVSLDPEKGWSVHFQGFNQNLAVAGSRQNWLTSVYGVKPSHILSIRDAVKADFKFTHGKLIFLFGDEFDTQGHDGELALSGPQIYLERYAQVIRKLRDAGYTRIFLTTDHGYFHYMPGEEEVIEKPTGDILWKTRRAIVGRSLKHKTAVLTRVAGSDLECLTPRSVNAFKTYGGMRFFHRGATLQEWLIPLVCVQWMKKSQKTGIVLKPISEITTQEPVVEIEPDTRGKKNLFGEVDGGYLGREIIVKVRDPASGKTFFRSGPVAVSPRDDVRQIRLEKVSGAEGRYGQKLDLVILDADNEEILVTQEVILKVDMDEWL